MGTTKALWRRLVGIVLENGIQTTWQWRHRRWLGPSRSRAPSNDVTGVHGRRPLWQFVLGICCEFAEIQWKFVTATKMRRNASHGTNYAGRGHSSERFAWSLSRTKLINCRTRIFLCVRNSRIFGTSVRRHFACSHGSVDTMLGPTVRASNCGGLSMTAALCPVMSCERFRPAPARPATVSWDVYIKCWIILSVSPSGASFTCLKCDALSIGNGHLLTDHWVVDFPARFERVSWVSLPRDYVTFSWQLFPKLFNRDRFSSM